MIQSGRRRGALRRTAAAVAAAVAATALAATAAPADAELVMDLRAVTVNGQPLPAGSTDNRVVVQTDDVVGINIIARVSGADDVNDEAIKGVFGVFRSSTGGLLGDLRSFNIAPFNGTGAQGGSQVDVDGDGDLDIGDIPNGGQQNMYFVAFSNAQEQGGTVVNTSPSTEEFLIGTMTFTSKSDNGETILDFIRRRNPGNPGSNGLVNTTWWEDLNTGTASVRNGTSPYTTDGLQIVGVPEPSGIALTSLASLQLLARRRSNEGRV